MDANKMQATADKITKVTLTSDDVKKLVVFATATRDALQNIIWLCDSSPSISSIKAIAQDALASLGKD